MLALFKKPYILTLSTRILTLSEVGDFWTAGVTLVHFNSNQISFEVVIYGSLYNFIHDQFNIKLFCY